MPGVLPGCPGPLGVFQKFVLKKVSAHFSLREGMSLDKAYAYEKLHDMLHLSSG